MMSEGTRARFLAAIADRVNPADVAEVHLFPAMKQGGIESGVAVVAVRPTPPQAGAENFSHPGAENFNRLTVYTATYRLTLKGPDRGKWEFALTAEAEAPLVTVDAVVRGVQRRSGDVEDPEKLSTEEFRALAAPTETPNP